MNKSLLDVCIGIAIATTATSAVVFYNDIPLKLAAVSNLQNICKNVQLGNAGVSFYIGDLLITCKKEPLYTETPEVKEIHKYKRKGSKKNKS